MTRVMQLVRDVAEFCHQRGIRLPVKDLAGIINAAGYRTRYGTSYKGRRGTYRLVKLTWRWLYRAGRAVEASMVETTFTRPDGGYAHR